METVVQRSVVNAAIELLWLWRCGLRGIFEDESGSDSIPFREMVGRTERRWFSMTLAFVV